MTSFSTFICFVNRVQADLNDKCTDIHESEFEISYNDQNVTVSERAVNNILSFARSYEVVKTESTGYAEIILN